ncbi:hypothetical protein [Alteromonas lipolytica]|nr:hypothetical protein [Alteromonas lipolytica]GGF80011.1 hypothetical protein GCM10011338_35450 [Alteromonas lipolytica]
MAGVMQKPVVGKCNDWLKERLTDPNMYCTMGAVAALALIELVIFA